MKNINVEKLLTQIAEKEAVIGVLGLGHTGLSLAHDFIVNGFKVIGFDIDDLKIGKLLRHENYLPSLPLDRMFYFIEENKFIPTSNPDELARADVLIIAVPTPLHEDRTPDISYILSASHTIAEAMVKHKLLITANKGPHMRRSSDVISSQLIVLQSTSYPGTTEEKVLPLLEEKTGQKVGVDFFLAHVPERIDPGHIHLTVLPQIPRICGGVTKECALLAMSLYEPIATSVFLCSSATVAEATKTYENAFRLVNIAFVDEMKIAFDQMGINIWEVIQAASTKPFGFTPFYPGPGIGGECTPVDPLALAWKAKQYKAPTSLIDNAALINIKMPEYVAQKVADALSLRQKALQDAKILLLGVTFKKDVGDVRESPALHVFDVLLNKGASVSYHDYFVNQLNGRYGSSITLTEETMGSFDCVLILTDHSNYDWISICKHSQLIVDTRNATGHVLPILKKNVVL